MPAYDWGAHWDRLARLDPYYFVLTDDKYRAASLNEEARREFFASGARHIELVFETIESRMRRGFSPSRVLDFGCGVGRVLAPLASRCRQVVGADISGAMLAEAEKHCVERGLANVELARADDSLSALSGGFDFVHSFLVFQHMPRRPGERLLGRLLELLGEGGVGAVHFVYAAELPARARALGWALRSFPPLRAGANLLRGREASYPLIHMYVYDLRRVLRILRRGGCRSSYAWFTDHQGYCGVMLFFEKVGATAPRG